jgi:DNA-binding transcriptional MerR regulator
MRDESRLSVKQLAEITGVSVRTLHHYDEIGLLVPAERTRAGYRRYGPGDVERLFRILIYRELGFDLTRIREILDNPDAQALDLLRRQRMLLTERIGRLQRMLKGVEAIMDSRQEGYNLTPDEMREVFGSFDPTEHAAEAEARWGDTDAYRQSKARTARYGRDDWLRIQAEAAEISGDMAAAMRESAGSTSPRAMDVAERHRRHISEWFYDCGYDIHRGLADMYVADPRFMAHFEEVEPGLAAYFRDAIVANAERAGE